MRIALAIVTVTVAAAVAASPARADVVPENYRALLEIGSIELTDPDPALRPLLPDYDAHWLARVLRGQAYLVRFQKDALPPQDAWLIVQPRVFIPRLGGRSGPIGWCGVAFHFIDAPSARWIFTVEVATAAASPVAPTARC